MYALKVVEELIRLTLDDARVAGNMSEPIAGRGQRIGGHQGHGGHQFGWRHTPVHDRTMEEASQSLDEMCLDTGNGMGCDAIHCHPCHTMLQIHPIGLPMGTHLSPHPWSLMIPAHPHPLLHLPYVSPTDHWHCPY